MTVQFGVDPTTLPYTIRCKVLVKEFAHQDEQSKETFQRQSKGVFLLPQQSSQCDAFLDAWLPDCRNKAPEHRATGEGAHYSEIACKVGWPVNGPCRAAVMRSRSWPHDIDQHYLFVMHIGAQDDLRDEWERKNGDCEVLVEVLPASDDTSVDKARDAEIPGRTIFGDSMLPQAPATGFLA